MTIKANGCCMAIYTWNLNDLNDIFLDHQPLKICVCFPINIEVKWCKIPVWWVNPLHPSQQMAPLDRQLTVE